MKKKEIVAKYQKDIKIFKKYNEHYFNKSKPLVSDSEYDDLKKNIINLEKKYKFLNSKDSPTFTVGYKPSKNFKVFIELLCFLLLMHFQRKI